MTTKNTVLYPTFEDKEFQKKISFKKEFNYRTKQTEKNCDYNARFELEPHQEFVKRFISYNTPYNGLLLFHGLGSGKTCSAIGISEEIRKYNKNNPKFKKVIIIASPDVQHNFKLQLFDRSKLKKQNGRWNLSTCVGPLLLEELNINEIHNLEKDKIIEKINLLIKDNYIFMGYIQFANVIENKTSYNTEVLKKKLKDEYEDRLIIIDEAHNIRDPKMEDDKKVSTMINRLIKNVSNIKLLLLTGTPIYNNIKEIIYLLNILHLNDNRKLIDEKTIFNKEGGFKENGENVFRLALNGYVSYVRGENPYTFPHLVYPFEYDKSFSSILMNKPRFYFNNVSIPEEQNIKHLDLYAYKMNEFQEESYNNTVEQIKYNINENETNDINFTKSSKPIQALNIVYPYEKNKYLIGEKGLLYNMKKTSRKRIQYEYNNINIFSYSEIDKYSIKIKNIIDAILNSEGIILVYSNYKSSGVIPLAMALEEIGFNRYGGSKNNLLKNETDKKINIHNLRGKVNTSKFTQGYYSIISGDKNYSPNNSDEIDALTKDNLNGERVKVVLITETGTEGLDLNNIRQVHIMDPWWNMNRIEQIIGRARRNCSHKLLPLEKRNVQVFLHTIIQDNGVETLDMYYYRNAEKKALEIGKITRIIKQMSVDCLLNNIDSEKRQKTIKLKLSNGVIIKDYNITDKSYSSLCDYNEECNYECYNSIIEDEYGIDKTTYSYPQAHNEYIIYDLKKLLSEKHIYRIPEIIEKRYKNKRVNPVEINYAIDYLLRETITDKYGTVGKIIKIADLLLFQPDNIINPYISSYERVNVMNHPKSFQIKLEHEETNKNEDKKYLQDINNQIDIILHHLEIYFSNLIFDKKIKINYKEIVIEHLFDNLLTIEDKINLLNELENKGENKYTENEKILYNVYKKYIIGTEILLENYDKLIMYTKYENTWILTDNENIISYKKKLIKYDIDDYSYKALVDYSGHKKDKKTFKIINISQDRQRTLNNNEYKSIIETNIKFKEARKYTIKDYSFIIEFLLRVYKNNEKDFYYNEKKIDKIIFISKIENVLLKN